MRETIKLLYKICSSLFLYLLSSIPHTLPARVATSTRKAGQYTHLQCMNRHWGKETEESGDNGAVSSAPPTLRCTLIPNPIISENPMDASLHSFIKLAIGNIPGLASKAYKLTKVLAPLRHSTANRFWSIIFVIPAEKKSHSKEIRRRNKVIFSKRGIDSH